MRKRTKKKLSKQEEAVLRVRKTMPCPTGTRVFKDRKKELNKKWCRMKGNRE